jgi:hypothetical protein
MNIYFKPTYLYIKQHKDTGLKYFGKTVSKDPTKYKGSGKYWMSHLKKYGNNVITLWYQLFTDEESIKEFALNFSKENNIVESKSWANLKPEDGLWGGGVKGIKIAPHSDEHKKKISESVKASNIKSGRISKPKVKKGRSKGGWKWSADDRAKLSAQRMGRTPWNKGLKKSAVFKDTGSESVS